MGIKVVVVDAGQLPSGVEFPPLDIDKYGWEQYPHLCGGDLAERCWRADIVVTLATPITAEILEKMLKIGLVICVGAACSGIDQTVLASRGVELLAFADADLSQSAGAQDVCNRVSAAIDHYLRSVADPETRR